LKFRLGNLDDIHELKMRQRQNTRPADLFPYVESLVGKRMKLSALEMYLVRCWIDELCDVYNIAMPGDREKFVAGVMALRTFISVRSVGSSWQSIKFLWAHWTELRYLHSYLPHNDR